MSEKILNSRMTQKHDIEANWLKATNFTPLQGELIVYDVDENYNYERIKMGDGVTNVNKLPFISSQVDWNQNDENAPDYVKNRTHWEEGVILPETELAVFEIEGATQYPILLSPLAQVEVGKKYVVVYNNTAYDIEAKFDEGDGVYSLAHDFGGVALFPEAIEYPSVGMIYGLVFAMDGSTPITLSIVEKDAPVHKLDPKFLPDTVVMAEPPVMQEIILPETVLTADPDNSEGAAVITMPPQSPVAVGDTVFITYNGTAYECTGADGGATYYRSVAFGNLAMMGLTGGNPDAPFVVILAPDGIDDDGDGVIDHGAYGAAVPLDGSTTITLSIVQMKGITPKQLVTDLTGKPMWEDKTHWVEPGKEGSVVMEQTELVNTVAGNGFNITTPFSLIAGEEYIVTIDGVKYQYTAALARNNLPCIGNGNIYENYISNSDGTFSDIGDADAPFFIETANPAIAQLTGVYGGIHFPEKILSCFVSIKTKDESEIVHKLDPKFIHTPDWEAKDGEPGYIENRTHWYYETHGVVLEETTATLMDSSDGMSQFTISNPALFLPFNGSTCKVAYNGVVYETKCITGIDEGIEMTTMGNAGFMDGESTGEPFILMLVHPNNVEDIGMSGMILDISGILNETGESATEVTLSIEGSNVDKKIIDKKYLPEEVNSYLENGNNERSLRIKDASAEDDTYSLGQGSLALGDSSKAAGQSATAIGVHTSADGYCAFASGSSTTASGWGSHAEGSSTISSGMYSHAEGNKTTAGGICSHAEGDETTASGNSSHAAGFSTVASGNYSHAEGAYSIASGETSFARGGIGSYYAKFSLTGVPKGVTYQYTDDSEENVRPSIGDFISRYSKIDSSSVYSIYSSCIVAVTDTEITLADSLDYTDSTEAKKYTGYVYHPTTASGFQSRADGPGSIASGKNSIAEGYEAVARGDNSHSIGTGTTTNRKDTIALGRYNRDEDFSGYSTQVTDRSKGYTSTDTVSVLSGAPEIDQTTGKFLYNISAKKLVSEVNVGDLIVTAYDAYDANRYDEVLEILSTSATHVFSIKEYLVVDYRGYKGTYALMLGNGLGGSAEYSSNAHAIDWDGNAYFAGDVYVQGDGKTFEFDGKKKLATEEYVNSKIPTPEDALALMIEMGFVDPVADETGAMYTDDNGKIFTY